MEVVTYYRRIFVFWVIHVNGIFLNGLDVGSFVDDVSLANVEASKSIAGIHDKQLDVQVRLVLNGDAGQVNLNPKKDRFLLANQVFFYVKVWLLSSHKSVGVTNVDVVVTVSLMGDFRHGNVDIFKGRTHLKD